MNHYYQVAISRPIRRQFTYSWEGPPIEIGSLVKVPFGRASLRGVVTGCTSEIAPELAGKIKSIISIEEDSPVISRKILELTNWMSQYYLCSWGEAIFNALPTFPKRKLDLNPSRQKIVQSQFLKTLTSDQQTALNFFNEKKQTKKPFLIHGVAGSGKTEVYLRIADEVLKAGKTVIYLVPEISLISQIKLFIEEAFPGEAVFFHSKQTPKERLEVWASLKKGEKKIVVGPRSALFAPLDNVGLIIMDEEHDDSYKQDETPRYHTFKTAHQRARLEGAYLMLGSATPSLEALEAVKEDKIFLIKMNERIGSHGRSHIQLVDMKRRRKKDFPYLSEVMQEKIDERLKRKEGILIFLNRRGHSTQVKCEECGFFYLCPHCDVALTYHQEAGKLVCHYCRYALKPAFKCPECSKQIVYAGFGTEKIESELARLFPDARIERIDRETVQKRGNLEAVLKRFREGAVDILVGTQMLSKGLDFKHLTLVGILLAEANLQLPDFRASERTYQLLEQVAGRSGRGELKGEVIIQTFLPDHYSIRSVFLENEAMYTEQELGHRRQFGYPPFKQMINLTLRGRTEESVIEASENLKKDLDGLVEGADYGIEILGPAPLPFYRLRGYFRWHIMVKGEELNLFKEKFSAYLTDSKSTSGVYTEIDVDPIHIL